MPLSGNWVTDAAGDKGIGPVDTATGVGKAWRGANISGDYADGRVVLYDTNGNALLTAANPAAVQGPAAHGSTATGNPIRSAGVYRASPPTVTDGNVADFLVDTAGRLYVRSIDGQIESIGSISDAETSGNGTLIAISKRIRTLLGGGLPSALSSDRLKTESVLYRSYGSGFEPWVGTSEEQTALTSAARTTTTISGDLIHRGRGYIIVCLRVTSASGTGGLKLRVSIGAPTYPAYLHDESPSTPITSTGRYYWAYGPGLPETGVPSTATNGAIIQRVNVFIPRTWRVHVVHNDASSYTYSVTFWEA